MKRCTNYPNRPSNHLIHSDVCTFCTFTQNAYILEMSATSKNKDHKCAHIREKKTLKTFVTNKSWNAAGHIRRKTQTITMRERERKNAYIVHNAHVLAIISSRNLFQSTILSSLILWYFIYIYIFIIIISLLFSQWNDDCIKFMCPCVYDLCSLLRQYAIFVCVKSKVIKKPNAIFHIRNVY